MAHKSLIGGTVYEKYGGADLINGTVYEKYYGKVLSSGTVYEVGFDSNAPAIFQVSKITSDTIGGDGEQFVLLSVTPKPLGTVKVTYGGLTKTVTDTSGVENPNSKDVYFGTFDGVSDDVATPDSGTLTIEGDYTSYSFCATYDLDKETTAKATGCLTQVLDTGNLITIEGEIFSNNRNLTSVILNDNCIAIKDNAFSYCTALSTIHIGSGVTELGTRAFSGCNALYNFTIDSKNPYITQEGNVWFTKDKSVLCGAINTFSGHYTIPSTVRSIAPFAFYYASTLPSVTIPNGVTEIGNYTFGYCSNLSSVTFPNKLVSIGNYAFSSTSLVNLNGLPNTLRTIGDNAFSSCSKLTDAHIPDGVTSIGRNLFYSCSALVTAHIPDGVEEVPYWCFYGAKALTTVYVGAKAIGSSSFNNCTKLSSVTLQHGLISIGDSAFSGCTSLATITIPATVTRIGSIAFHLPTTANPRTIYILSTTPASIESKTFNNMGYNLLVVPKGTSAVYKSATNWSNFADYITEAA